jgi:hypothetical protein
VQVTITKRLKLAVYQLKQLCGCADVIGKQFKQLVLGHGELFWDMRCCIAQKPAPLQPRSSLEN